MPDPGPGLRSPTLVFVTDEARLRGRALEDVARDAALGGADIVQLRSKASSHSAIVAAGARLRDTLAGHCAIFINGDARAALALNADGLHLPEDGSSIAEARRLVGPHMRISRAVHSVEAAVQAERDGADLIQLGAIFETASHPGRAPVGLAGVRAVCSAVRIPVIGIGGITAANAGDVLRAGAAGVAVIGAILDAPDAREAASALRRAIDAAIPARA